jgi:hypothetical protein
VHKYVRRPYKKALGDMQPYGGSTWFTLTRRSAQRVVDGSSPDDPFVRLCRYSPNPDEHFVHTVLGNFAEAKSIKPGSMYTRWSSGASSPGALEAHDIEHLAAIPGSVVDDAYGRHVLMFGRKFSDGSPELVELVEEKCWSLPLGVARTSADPRAIADRDRLAQHPACPSSLITDLMARGGEDHACTHRDMIAEDHRCSTGIDDAGLVQETAVADPHPARPKCQIVHQSHAVADLDACST